MYVVLQISESEQLDGGQHKEIDNKQRKKKISHKSSACSRPIVVCFLAVCGRFSQKHLFEIVTTVLCLLNEICDNCFVFSNNNNNGYF